jgi:hypothetical protein
VGGDENDRHPPTRGGEFDLDFPAVEAGHLPITGAQPP